MRFRNGFSEEVTFEVGLEVAVRLPAVKWGKHSGREGLEEC